MVADADTKARYPSEVPPVLKAKEEAAATGSSVCVCVCHLPLALAAACQDLLH